MLYKVSRIHLFLPQKVTRFMGQVPVISRLDCCNSLLAGVACLCLSSSAAHPQCSSPECFSPEFSPTSPPPLPTSPPCTGYRRLREYDSSHWCLPTVLRLAQAHPTSRTWSSCPVPVPPSLCTVLYDCHVFAAPTLGGDPTCRSILIVCCPGSTTVRRPPH